MAPPEGRKISPYSSHCAESCDVLREKKNKTEKLEDRLQTGMAVKLGEEKKKRPGCSLSDIFYNKMFVFKSEQPGDGEVSIRRRSDPTETEPHVLDVA